MLLGGEILKIELRNNMIHVSGYVNAVERESRVLHDSSGEFVEVMKEGVFRKSLERNSDVGLMFNHTRSLQPDNMTLIEDSIGLKIDADVSDPEVIQNAKDGKLTGFSFGFRCLQSDFEERDGLPRLRNVTDIDLIEVSILNCMPAYRATEIDTRGLIEQRGEVTDVEIDDTELKALEQLNTYKQHFNFIKGE